MSLSGLRDMYNKINQEFYTIYRAVKTGSAPDTGFWHTTWKAAGLPFAEGTNPAGSPGMAHYGNRDNPAPSDEKFVSVNFGSVGQSGYSRYIYSLGGTASVAANYMLADRLVSVGGFSTATAAALTINSTALPRYTSGYGVQVYVELTTATSTTGPCVLAMTSYTNDSGVAGQSGASITFPAAATKIDDLIGPLPLQSGDNGVQSVQTITIQTVSNSGVFNVVLLKPICHIGFPVANQWNETDFVLQHTSLPQIQDNACLMITQQATTTTATNVDLQVRSTYG